MTAPYYKLVSSIRRAFPQPVSDREHDAYFVFSIMRALDQVDAMKSESPVLGEPSKLVITMDMTSHAQCPPGLGFPSKRHQGARHRPWASALH